MKKIPTFKSVVLKNEYNALRGKNGSTIWYLLLIMYITFLCFGFSKSALDFQKKLSSNPFSNWINITYHTGNKESLGLLEEVIQKDTFRTKYHIKESYFYNMWMFSIMSKAGDTAISPFQARSIEPQSDIVKDLLQPRNLVQKNFPDSVTAFSNQPNGIIVTQRLLTTLGLDYRTVSYLSFRDEGLKNWVPLPIVAVVKEIPDLADIVCTNIFYCKKNNSGLYDNDNLQFRFFIEDINRDSLLKIIPSVFQSMNLEDPGSIMCDSNLRGGNAKIQNWLVTIDNEGESISFSAKNKMLAEIPMLKNYHYGQYFKISADTICDNSGFAFENLAIEFINLEKIREFSDFIKEEYDISLNMEVLTERENYLFAGNMALGAIIMVLLLSIVSVTIYISSSIRNHLERIKKNLGNFLAFGVKNSILISLYIIVAFRILLTAMIPAFLLSLVSGELFEEFFLGKILVLEKGQDYFSLTNIWFVAFILLILLIAVLRTYFSVRYILKHTPGDLVYERDGKNGK
ncbi:MAG: hypothetical protein ACOYN4_01685 [Bacteroidales bacterium]